ncbi:MAG: SUMF1/EgtB/PvdO family nonheme iron enzyme [Magnetococcales bacterium]|nr:SUMF1/EgtB/PvdO family nonheme iron enzyme [Magnetococcales bacterium]
MSKIFISYSHEDDLLLKEFLPFKKTLERDGLVAVWTDKEIKTGDEWRKKIKEAMDAANTAILFISQSFLASEFIYNEELPPLLDAHLNRGLTILPVFVSPFDEEAAKISFKDPKTGEEKIIDLAGFQGFASPDHTLEQWESLERKNIFRALNKRIRELSQHPPDPPTKQTSVPDRQQKTGTPAVRSDVLSFLDERLPGLRMLRVEGGVFTMGDDDLGDRSKPKHQVQLSPFYLAETPVTNQQYGRFLQDTGHREPRSWREKKYSDLQQPVVGVDWNDAMKFCKWLSKESGKEFFLPTEAQWEYAARGTDGRRFPWGNDDPTLEHACFGQQRDKPALVGQYPAGRGPFGHLDLAGNVWEWCRDVWDANAYQKRALFVAKDPLVTEGDQNVHPVRGGSWSAGFRPPGRLPPRHPCGLPRRQSGLSPRRPRQPWSLIFFVFLIFGSRGRSPLVL